MNSLYDEQNLGFYLNNDQHICIHSASHIVNTDANKPRWFLHITYTHLRIHVYQLQCALYMCDFDNTSVYGVSQKPSHSLEEYAWICPICEKQGFCLMLVWFSLVEGG